MRNRKHNESNLFIKERRAPSVPRAPKKSRASKTQGFGSSGLGIFSQTLRPNPLVPGEPALCLRRQGRAGEAQTPPAVRPGFRSPNRPKPQTRRPECKRPENTGLDAASTQAWRPPEESKAEESEPAGKPERTLDGKRARSGGEGGFSSASASPGSSATPVFT